MTVMEQWERFKKESLLDEKTRGDARMERICLLCFGFGIVETVIRLQDAAQRLRVIQELDLLEKELSEFKERLEKEGV